MNILASFQQYLPHSRVGAWISTHEVLKHLARQGHNVHVVVENEKHRGGWIVDGVKVTTNRHDTNRLITTADLLISHCGDNRRAHNLAVQYRTPSVRFAHGAPVYPKQVNGSALVIYNSAALRAQTIEAYPKLAELSSHVTPPPVKPDDYRTEPGDKITLVNLSTDKGFETFAALADHFPTSEFLGVMGSYGIQHHLDRPNVKIIPPVVDMKNVYSQTSIVLMPSKFETYGRIPVEAACSCIPAICSDLPGIREAMGNAATYVQHDDIDGWKTALSKLHNKSSYRAASKRAAKHAETLRTDDDLDELTELLQSLTTHPARSAS